MCMQAKVNVRTSKRVSESVFWDGLGETGGEQRARRTSK